MIDEILKTLLKKVKELTLKKGVILANRDKNVEFLREYGLTDECVKEAILQLTPRNYRKGPEEDRDGYPGYVYVFKSNYLTEDVIYIKIRYNPPDELVFISFHKDNK
ncbi:type II toxin-antitoxin system MqsR family toxin [Clostridium perfringens]|uniref:type II toxin-antitoxin system MqsR family toxin n=1 Tax=Clostridium perfringens TaxID=1502 RepID=UPI0018AA599B|nr:type II toxin-antitoxin system MqsR family toxin [Clostridium perfringens]MDB2068282.1 type II toxin-antitoxin system MqsR family toxin [Clostridium perfringens]